MNNLNFRKKQERKNKIASFTISVGGYAIIVSIIAIFSFLLYKAIPLISGASIDELLTIKTKSVSDKVILTGLDQYREVGYSIDGRGLIEFHSLKSDSSLSQSKIKLDESVKILSFSFGDFKGEYFAVGTDDGQIITSRIKMSSNWEKSIRTIIPAYKEFERFNVPIIEDSLNNHVEQLEFTINQDRHMFWSWLNHNGELFLKIYNSDEEEYFDYALNSYLEDVNITSISLSHEGELLIVGDDTGQLFWFDISDFEEILLRDNWQVYNSKITALSFLIGDNSLVIGNENGNLEVWFPVRDRDDKLKFTQIHSFDKHNSAISHLVASPRKRDFISVSKDGDVHLNYSTTENTQIKFTVSENPIVTVSFAPKSDGLIFADSKNNLSYFELSNPHPETTLKSLFGKVKYEGYPEAQFVWQSTGGSDEFESKISLIPLIFGTFKGTLYAMLFSVPLALLGAIYISQFSPRKLALYVKPTIEIMAALPSVVIGFLAGLYFSPLFEEYLMSVGLMILIIPVVLLIFIVAWGLIPEEKRRNIAPGRELLFIIPIIFLSIWISTLLASPVENIFFGGDLKQWLYESMGINYDQRNSIVVGFALGFAVVPIIFTIAEDALSNVPNSLTSAALALGASKWQAVMRVVLPAAAGGIFAAIMLGLGRAIGETMIVLMATGNTPIIDLSPFNGFRAMSACIAVEIPEAPVDGTLYRVLFLTAFILFIFTFFINSLAGWVGDKLRKKYARF